MERKIVGLVLAAGYGHLRPGVSKLVETVNGASIINHSLGALKKAGLGEPVIVLNPKFGPQIVNNLEFTVNRMVFQLERTGPVQAVICALPALRELGATDLLAVLGDMPLLNADSIAAIARAHLGREESVLTVSSWPFDPAHPLAARMFNYAYLDMRREDGSYPPTPVAAIYNGTPREETAVLSSIYAINLDWLEKAAPRVEPHDKGDGFSPERHLPRLVNEAARDERRFINLTEPRPEPLIGVNTLEDLQFACEILER